MRKTIEAFADGAIGVLFGILIASYFFENPTMLVIGGGIGAIVGRIVFPFFLDVCLKIINLIKEIDISIAAVKYKTFFVIICILIVLVGFYYMTVDNYDKGQRLYVTTSVQLKREPGVGGTKIRTLKSGESVIYINKLWKRTRWHESGNRYHSFWREVKTNKNEVGWVYGAYLTEDR